jgi:hypothetical protein
MVNDTVWKKRVEPDRPQMSFMRRMRFACRLTKSVDPRTQYVTPTAFPQQHGLRVRALILSYTYIACLFDPVLNKIYSYLIPTDYSCTNYFNIIPSSVLSYWLN